MESITDVLRHRYPQFNTIHATRSIHDALTQMHCENVDYLIVLDEERFLGVLTDHGLAEKIIHRTRDMDIAPVKDFMTTYLPVVTLNDSLEYCMQLMERYNVRHLVVYDSFKFKGIISAHDLIKQVLLKRKASFSEETEVHNPWDY